MHDFIRSDDTQGPKERYQGHQRILERDTQVSLRCKNQVLEGKTVMLMLFLVSTKRTSLVPSTRHNRFSLASYSITVVI
jgi:hypothetical protein